MILAEDVYRLGIDELMITLVIRDITATRESRRRLSQITEMRQAQECSLVPDLSSGQEEIKEEELNNSLSTLIAHLLWLGRAK